jgi:hypothetical protein
MPDPSKITVTPDMVAAGIAAYRDDDRSDDPDAEMVTRIYRAMADVVMERLRKGVAKAQAEGKYKGQPPTIDWGEVRRLYPKIGAVATARQLGITKASVYRILGKAA